MAGRRLARAVSGPRDRRCHPGFWAALMAAALAVAGCGGTGGSPSAAPRSSSLPKTTLTACTEQGLAAECGNVWVPQDWAHPAGPAMPLQVVVLPATATSHPAAPLFYLAGWGGDGIGGGDSVFNGLDWAAQAFAQLNQTMDLVFVEQRGTTGSGLQTCPGLENWLASPAAIQAAARRCLASASRDPRHDTTPEAVLDLDQVRRALGYRPDQHLRRVLRRDDGPGLPAALQQPRPRRGAGQRLAAERPGGAAGRRARPARLRPGGRPLRGHPCLRPVLPPRRRPGHHPGPPDRPPGPGHPARPRRPAPDPHRHRRPCSPAMVDIELSSVQTAVLLPAVLHALALGQWSQVISRLGLTAAD